MFLAFLMLVVAFFPLWFFASMLFGNAVVAFFIVGGLYIAIAVMLVWGLFAHLRSPRPTAPKPDSHYLRH